MTISDAQPDRALSARIAEIRQGLDVARFGGSSPIIDIPSDAASLDVVAHVLAAERSNAGLSIAGARYRLHDDAAEASLRGAFAAMRSWSLADAERRLEYAGARAVDPLLQQRVGLWLLLVALVQHVVRTEPDRPLRADADRWALDFLRGADRLPDAERGHYRDEVARVVASHAEARQQPASASGLLWYVLRARRALAADEPLATLLWLLCLARNAGASLAADEYLGALLGQARTFVRLALDDVPPDEVAQARDDTKGLQAWDVYRSLVARLGDALGIDAQRETERFTVRPYREDAGEETP